VVLALLANGIIKLTLANIAVQIAKLVLMIGITVHLASWIRTEINCICLLVKKDAIKHVLWDIMV
jgi:hypothetical protein